MSVLGQAQADLPRREFQPGRGGAELFDAEGIADADLFPASAPSGTQIRSWNGSAWVTGTLMRWSGAVWEPATLRRWTGAMWSAV